MARNSDAPTSRLDLLRGDPPVLVDPARGPEAVASTLAALKSDYSFTDVVGVLAVTSQADTLNILKTLEPAVGTLVVTGNSAYRSLPPEALAARAAEVFGPDRVLTAAGLGEALTLASGRVRDGGCVLVTGSPATARDARRLLAPPEPEPRLEGRAGPLVVALIGLAGAVLTAVVAGLFGLLNAPDEMRITGPAKEKHHAGPSPLATGDAMHVTGITLTDGIQLAPNRSYLKIWALKNSGSVPWRNRFLQRMGEMTVDHDCLTARRVPIPYTRPGETTEISVKVATPGVPTRCYAEWNMTDAHGFLLFPDRKPVTFDLTVAVRS
ncbi:hypothetical protein Misp01_55890 [Microtetraspora sp. NBRC 13810]|uniref:NBR1-Ig-like domain-containing protein n=1 Tax=Microtetraspora sp. NBRC 13810 TaxID=3030990 RepID=UPI00249FAE7E|nr:NBR1-Ig-like domain-containing protein [Microtetraspora sp. NBRC 13810]GLW10461.1 hypothetical protein Misp01_55890 [Microtetraspora sp. NBRC 13810]